MTEKEIFDRILCILALHTYRDKLKEWLEFDSSREQEIAEVEALLKEYESWK